jgi:hypothetical protein
MILTPEQIGRIVRLLDRPGETLYGEDVQSIANTLAVYAEIVQRLAELGADSIYDSEYDDCFFCGGPGHDPGFYPMPHAPDCLYLAARKLRALP